MDKTLKQSEIETGYIEDGEASRHYFVCNKVSMPIEWADIVVPYIKNQQLALINKIEELESMQDELTTTHEEGWLVNRKLDRNRLRSELREGLKKIKEDI